MDRADIRKIYFQDPERSHLWHTLDWEHAPALNGPASLEALKYARRIAAKTHRFPDTKRALIELLERWGAGLTVDRAERRMAVRLSQDRLRLMGEDGSGVDEIAELPSVRRLTELSSPNAGTGRRQAPDVQVGVVPADEDLGGDDDEDEECEAAPADEETAGLVDEDEYYADVWESR
ncbi:hypothetical protein [Streptomyces sp. A1277]|uniref:hypothetical protein n=1 Tax=Streptomyces sp. A1277 TaxID=2563103 RepID=UPI001F0E4378|nr:hypothetical protein [Streptomyces sp. A1277]